MSGATGTGSGRRRDARPAPATTPLFDSLPRTTWIDVAVLTGLSLLAVAGFEPAFGHYAFAQAAIGGIVVGGGVALLGRLLRLSWPLTTVIALAAYFLFGTPLALPGEALYGAAVSTACPGWSSAPCSAGPTR